MTLETIKRHIAAGVYDDDLAEILENTKKRLLEVRKARSANDFGLGDKIRFNSYCGVSYLRGQQGVVVGRSGSKVTVKLSNPIGNYVEYVDGKWQGSEVLVPPSIIDLV